MAPRVQPRAQPAPVAAVRRLSDDAAADQGANGDADWHAARSPGTTAAPGGADAAPPKPARAPRKKDPKLDLDLLEAAGGFDDLWHKLVPAFKASYQGEGHEVADLRRLLELYGRWQSRFYPHCDFDTFVLKLEKAGRSRVIKAKLGQMRQGLLGVVFPDDAQQPAAEQPATDAAQVPAAAGGARLTQTQAPMAAVAGAAVPAAAAAPAAGPAAPEYDEDDELVAMQREAEWDAVYAAMDALEAAAPARQGGQAAGGQAAPPAAEAGPSLDELLDMAAEAEGQAGAWAAAAAAANAAGADGAAERGQDGMAEGAGTSAADADADMGAERAALAALADMEAEVEAAPMEVDERGPPEEEQEEEPGQAGAGAAAVAHDVAEPSGGAEAAAGVCGSNGAHMTTQGVLEGPVPDSAAESGVGAPHAGSDGSQAGGGLAVLRGILMTQQPGAASQGGSCA